MKKLIALSLVLVVTFILSGCGPTSQTQNNSNNPLPTSESATGLNAINIQNFSFNPSTLTIKKGVTVIWTNNDSAPHQIKSSALNSNELVNGQSFSFTFTNSGTFEYSCAIHPSMTGKIIVE